MAKTKFFRIAVEGATAYDGRVILREWIDQAAAGYNAATYTARINCEHIRGYSPQPPFNAYGSVLSLKADDHEIQIDGKTQKRRALYAELDANDQLIQTVKADQKIFTSCEFAPDFAKTGKAGLVGLAITDNPASLGTEALNFAALKPQWQSRLTEPTNFFTPVEENKFELAEAAPGLDAETKSLFSTMVDLLKGVGKPAGEPEKPVTPPANDNDARFTSLADGISKLSQGIETALTKISGDVGTLRTDFGALKADLEKTPNGQQLQRHAATGGNAAAHVATDC